MTGWRKFITGVALVGLVGALVSACQVDGSAQPNAAAVASVLAASSGVGTLRPSTTGSPGSVSTIEDHSTSVVPTTSGHATVVPSPSPSSSESLAPTTTAPTTAAPTTTADTRPTVVMANDGFAVSIMVTTIWSRALVGEGVKVGIRTIGETADQIAALKDGQVDLVQQYNSGLLNYLDANSDAIGETAVDQAIAAKLPAGLAVLNSTPAKDDVQLTVSAATAAKYQLHSITDLSAHLADLTLLLPDDSSAKSFSNGLSNYYGLTFPNIKTTDFGGSKTINAIKSSASVGLMDASQYQIDDLKFVVLTDPEHLFLTENFIPLVAGRKLTASMRATINAVSAKLSVTALRGLRKKVATGQGTFTEVADEWLASVGLK